MAASCKEQDVGIFRLYGFRFPIIFQSHAEVVHLPITSSQMAYGPQVVRFQDICFPIGLNSFCIFFFFLQTIADFLKEVCMSLVVSLQTSVESEGFRVVFFAEVEVGYVAQQLGGIQNTLQNRQVVESEIILERVVEFTSALVQFEETIQVVYILVTDDFGAFGILFHSLGLLVVHHVVQFLWSELMQHEVTLRRR